MVVLLEKNMVLLFLIGIMLGVSNAEVYRVGDSNGWTSIGLVDYKSWASSKTFHVGDTILFVYDNKFHDVTRVTHENFNSCNTTAPYATWSSGNDSFRITSSGHYYFICGVPGHCESGQRVDIRVPRPDSSAHTGAAPHPHYSAAPPHSKPPSPRLTPAAKPPKTQHSPAPSPWNSYSPAPSPDAKKPSSAFSVSDGSKLWLLLPLLALSAVSGIVC